MNPQTLDYALNKLFRPEDAQLFSLGDVFLAMLVATLLCFVLVQVYQATHRSASYSHSFVQTVFLMGVSTAVVMMIIGSNIARAFSLVGALSVIRFRTAVKDSRDTGYLYAAMVVGMGCGTDFYMPAIAFTAFVATLMVILHWADFGFRTNPEYILRVSCEQGDDNLDRIQTLVDDLFDSCRLINQIHDCGENMQISVYLVRAKDSEKATTECKSKLGELKFVKRFNLFKADQETPL